MNFDEFSFQFKRLVKAFQVQKPDEKLDIYFEELKKIDVTVFAESCRRVIRDEERFPTIAKLLSIADMVKPKNAQVGANCALCNGFGWVSLWNHDFRARCQHGQKLSKSVAFEPVTENDRLKSYMNLSQEWKKLYGKDFPYDINAEKIY